MCEGISLLQKMTPIISLSRTHEFATKSAIRSPEVREIFPRVFKSPATISRRDDDRNRVKHDKPERVRLGGPKLFNLHGNSRGLYGIVNLSIVAVR